MTAQQSICRMSERQIWDSKENPPILYKTCHIDAASKARTREFKDPLVTKRHFVNRRAHCPCAACHVHCAARQPTIRAARRECGAPFRARLKASPCKTRGSHSNPTRLSFRFIPLDRAELGIWGLRFWDIVQKVTSESILIAIRII